MSARVKTTNQLSILAWWTSTTQFCIPNARYQYLTGTGWHKTATQLRMLGGIFGFVWTYTPKSKMLSSFSHIYIYTHVRSIYVYYHWCICISLYVYTYTHTYDYICIYIYIYISIKSNKHIYIHTYIYVDNIVDKSMTFHDIFILLLGEERSTGTQSDHSPDRPMSRSATRISQRKVHGCHQSVHDSAAGRQG